MSVAAIIRLRADKRAGVVVASVTLDDGEELELEIGPDAFELLWLDTFNAAADSVDVVEQYGARFARVRRMLSARARAALAFALEGR